MIYSKLEERSAPREEIEFNLGSAESEEPVVIYEAEVNENE